MQLDLGELYDIETVNITHFFTDGRTFNGTKTEVSSDGVNWTTLFDSAIYGTYVETSEGQSYEIEDVGGNIGGGEVEYDLETEEGLDAFLKSLFEDNIQTNSEISGEIHISDYNISSKINEILNKKSKSVLDVNNLIAAINILDVSRFNGDPAYIQSVFDIFTTNLQDRLDGNILHIFEHEYTPNIENGYVGGFYFKVNNPALIQEAGIEYHTELSSSNNHVWKKQIIPNEGDSEFASLILTKNSVTTARGYVIDKNNTKVYTSALGNIIQTDIPYYIFYENIPLTSIVQDQDGVDIAIAPLALVAGSIYVAGLGWTVYTCANEGIISWACGIDAGLTFVPVGRVGGFVGNLLPKKFVTKFFGYTGLTLVSDITGNIVESFAKLGLKAKIRGQIIFQKTQVQSKFSKHASDFGITLSWSEDSYQLILKAFNTHLDSSNTIIKKGLYDDSNIPVYHFYNTVTKNNIMFKEGSKEYISGWKLSDSQIHYLLTTGHIK